MIILVVVVVVVMITINICMAVFFFLSFLLLSFRTILWYGFRKGYN